MVKELVEFIAKGLTDHPDQVQVTEVAGERSVVLELRVAEEDLGKVIGKQGRIAKAMRTVVKAAGPQDSKPVHVEIID